jgi:hypothetical protein
MTGPQHTYNLRGPPRHQPQSARLEHFDSLTPNSGSRSGFQSPSGSGPSGGRTIGSPRSVSDGGGLSNSRYINGSGEIRKLADAPTNNHSFRSQFFHTPPNLLVPGSDHIVVLGTIPHSILQYTVAFYADILLVAEVEAFLGTAFDAMPGCPRIRILIQLREDIGEQAGFAHPFYHRISNDFVNTMCEQHADIVEQRIMNETYRVPSTPAQPSTGVNGASPLNDQGGAADVNGLRREAALKASNEIRSFGSRMNMRTSSTIKALLKELRCSRKSSTWVLSTHCSCTSASSSPTIGHQKPISL